MAKTRYWAATMEPEHGVNNPVGLYKREEMADGSPNYYYLDENGLWREEFSIILKVLADEGITSQVEISEEAAKGIMGKWKSIVDAARKGA